MIGSHLRAEVGHHAHAQVRPLEEGQRRVYVEETIPGVCPVQEIHQKITKILIRSIVIK
jgi:hypothetical protein